MAKSSTNREGFNHRLATTDDQVQDRPEEQREGEKLTQAAPKVADEKG